MKAKGPFGTAKKKAPKVKKSTKKKFGSGGAVPDFMRKPAGKGKKKK